MLRHRGHAAESWLKQMAALHADSLTTMLRAPWAPLDVLDGRIRRKTGHPPVLSGRRATGSRYLD